MRIAVSVLGDLLVDIGTTVRARHIANLMAKEHEITMIWRSNEHLDDSTNITITPSGTRLWNLKLIPMIRKHDFDVIYCGGDFFGFLSYYYFARKGTKLIMEVQGIISIEYLHGRQSVSQRIVFRFYQWLERFVVKRADYVIALSNEIESFYSRYNRNITTIPGFIDENIFFKSERKTELSTNRVLGIIGPFEGTNINNHFLEFIKANLGKLDPRISIKVIGKIDDELKFVHDRVVFTGYLATVQEYRKELDTLDAVAVPSVAESYGALNKILEPMALGKLVFATPQGYAGLENIPIGEAIIVAPENELVNLINSTIFDDALVQAIGTKAQNIVVNDYTRSGNREKIMKVLRHLQPV